MRLILTLSLIILTSAVFSQSELPFFLEGTWKTEDGTMYEHWDKLNNQTLKGFSYKFSDKQMVVSEYLEIHQNAEGIFHVASVLNQNMGEPITFKLVKSDSLFSFENPGHDFPKVIAYRFISSTEVLVELSGGDGPYFAYRMKKLHRDSALSDSVTLNPEYDPELARSLGADDYGMKPYTLVILTTGTNSTTDKAFISACFRGHLDNINRLVEEGKLVVAGPLEKNSAAYRGIFILDAPTLEEARDLLKTDPAIKEDLLDFEIYKWYGSAALPEYLESSNKIWKLKP